MNIHIDFNERFEPIGVNIELNLAEELKNTISAAMAGIMKPEEKKPVEKKAKAAKEEDPEWQEAVDVPFEIPKGVPDVVYTLQDIQQAVRDAIKAHGKETVKGILSKYPAEGGGKATSASSLKEESYQALIEDLKGLGGSDA